MNVVALRGVLSRPAEERVLPSGDRLLNLELTIRPAEGPAEGVPVVWPGPPAAASTLDVGDEVVVVGRVRRRFFRSGGSTQSRTEVVADAILPARSGKRIAKLLAEAAERVCG